MADEFLTAAESWACQTLPRWLYQALREKPRDATARCVGADYLEEAGADPNVVLLYRFMGLAPKYPTEIKLSENPENLTRGWGWLLADQKNPSTLPRLLTPPKPIILHTRSRFLPRRAAPRWAWGTFWEAEKWFADRWLAVTGEVRSELLLSVGIQT